MTEYLVTTNSLLPFGPLPSLRLGLIGRWAIVKTKRRQTVAEHCFNVATISEWLCGVCKWSPTATNAVIQMALHHDDDEVWTGDVPSTAKLKTIGAVKCNAIIKLADTIEAYSFIKVNCDDSQEVKNVVMTELWESIISQLNHTECPEHKEIKNFIKNLEIQ